MANQEIQTIGLSQSVFASEAKQSGRDRHADFPSPRDDRLGAKVLTIKSGSYILVGSKDVTDNYIQASIKQTDNKWLESIKLPSISDTPVTISDVRSLIVKIRLKPFDSSTIKYLVIIDATNLSKEVSNSLLKLLEETPNYVAIYLAAQSVDNILPTIRSRCQIIRVDSQDAKTSIKPKYSIDAIRKMNLAEMFKIANEISKANAINSLNEWVDQCREHKLESLPLFIQAYHDMIHTNMNKRLLLENIFIRL